MTAVAGLRLRPASLLPRSAPIGVAVAIAGLLTLVQPDGPVLCIFRRCTGHACPGCGLTRACAALVRGDTSLAWRYHPFVFFLALQAVALGVVATLPAGRRAVSRHGHVLLAINAVGLLLLWLARWRWGLLGFVVDA